MKDLVQIDAPVLIRHITSLATLLLQLECQDCVVSVTDVIKVRSEIEPLLVVEPGTVECGLVEMVKKM